MSVNGGNEKTKFYVSGSFLKQDGILKESGMSRYSGRFNLDHKLSRVIDFGLSTA